MKTTGKRCAWPGEDKLMIKYHDQEWGVPVHDDRKLFEFLLLDTFQAGLSWRIILHKRANFKKSFDNFDYQKIAEYGEAKIKKLMNDPSIIRNRSKIVGTVKNAKAFLKIRNEFGTFDKYLWRFVGGKTKMNKYRSDSHLRSRSTESDALSKDLKRRGFAFVGTTVCYAFMQGAGLVNDHLVTCPRYKRV